jgi:ArsR family transcriptional regulator, arsenate/arsenite/antimonite-responsive transcriptional repressor
MALVRAVRWPSTGFDTVGAVTPARSNVDPIACCGSVRQDVLAADDADRLARSFSALADPVRLRLLSMVAAAGDGEICACDLVEGSGRSQPTVSHHMKTLVDAGLVTREKRGLWVWYRIVPTRLDALRAVLG